MTQDNNIINSAKAVFEREIEGLQALESWLGQEFCDAVELIESVSGKIVLSGMGKSGHIANKIAATMSSTGNAAIFVHPGEASHGDLGMIAENDVVILLSNSGETAELRDIINYCKRFNIPLIGIVRRKTSVLVKAANVALILPDVPEACSVEAPTTSTTMMIALGDALAVSLLEKKGFDKDDFNVFHPGGKLGAVFSKVSDLMHEGDSLPVVKDNDLMTEVIIKITEKRLGCAIVVDSQDKLIGVITDGDLRRNIDGISTLQASDVMTANPVTVASDSLVAEALAIMQDSSITALIVKDSSDEPVGIIHIHDILKAGAA